MVRHAPKENGVEMAKQRKGIAWRFCWLVIEEGQAVSGPYLSRAEAEEVIG